MLKNKNNTPFTGRKLASIQKILNIEPIPKADRIVKATILGWEVVVRKDEFKIGDLCVYVQIDSLLPDKEWCEFMRERKFRVKTIKLRKQISQGIAFPLSIIKQSIDITEGMDVTKTLEIKQWYPYKTFPRSINTKNMSFIQRWKARKKYNKRRFPSHLVPKTSETRIQNSPSILTRHKGDLITFTEKLDGTSATYIKKGRKFIICSRNLIRKSNDNSVYSQIAKTYQIKNKIINNIAIQGEIIGFNPLKNSSVQNGTGINYGRDKLEFYVFNVYDIKEQRYYNIFEFQAFCRKYKFKIVPQLGTYTLPGTIKEVISWAHGESKLHGAYLREGLVVRSKNMIGNRWEFSFKVVDPLFQLKYEKKGVKK